MVITFPSFIHFSLFPIMLGVRHDLRANDQKHRDFNVKLHIVYSVTFLERLLNFPKTDVSSFLVYDTEILEIGLKDQQNNHWHRGQMFSISELTQRSVKVTCSTVYRRSSLWYMLGEGNGTPLQYSCLENPMDGGPGGL